MKERLYTVLNIKLSESSRVFDLLTVQFFIGLANAFIGIIALTLFIYSFPVSVLPQVYLAVAAALILLNVVYEKLEHLFSPLQLLKYIISFCILLTAALWFGMMLGNKEHFIFALMVSGILIYMVTGYAFWGLVSLLFNVRESRRVFSVVGSGDIPAKLIGYMAVPLLIPIIGITHLLWIAILCLITGLWLFHRYIKKSTWDTIRHQSQEEHQHHAHEEDIFTKKDFVSFFFKNRLIFVISLLSVLSYNVFVLIDFTFIAQVKTRYENMSELALYMAIFFGLGRALALAFKLIFTSRVIERLGVVYSLFITPIVLLLFCLCFFLFGSRSNFSFYAFGLVAMITEVLRSSIQEPVFFILFQPLKESLRLKGHIISKGYMYPPSLIVVGLTLFLLYRYQVEPTIILSVKIVLINLVVWAGIIFLLRITYLRTVHDSIRKGFFSSDDIYLHDKDTVILLLNKVTTGKDREVIYALNILEKSGYGDMEALLINQLHAERDTTVKQFALERLDARGVTQLPMMEEWLKQDMAPELRQQYISYLCRHNADYLREAVNQLHSYDTAIKKTIIVLLLNQREFDQLHKAGIEITRLLHSPQADDRISALEIISHLKHVQFTDAIRMLITDTDFSVRRAAIQTACHLRMKAILPQVFAWLSDADQKNIALKGLLQYGDKLFEDITTLPKETVQGHLPHLVKIAGKLKGANSTLFLVQLAEEESYKLKDHIVHALWSKEYEPGTHTETDTFTQLLQHQILIARHKMADYQKVPEFLDKELVKASLYNEVKTHLSSTIKISVMLYGVKELNRILELLEMNKQSKLYNGMEMIDLVLPKKTSKEINALFDFVLDPQQTRAPKQGPAHEFFSKIVFSDTTLYNPWTQSVCVFSSWRSQSSQFIQQLKNQTHADDHFLVRETKDYVLAMSK